MLTHRHRHRSQQVEVPPSSFSRPRDPSPPVLPHDAGQYSDPHVVRPVAHRSTRADVSGVAQLFSREQGGFVISLSLANAQLHVSTTLDQKFLVPGELYLPSCPVEKYWGRTVNHRMLVTWGPRGSIDCKHPGQRVHSFGVRTDD